MTAIARDAVAATQLVYAWPFPIGPECAVACGEDEYVVMCPAWLVGDRLGPGHHHWRTPDPTRPSSAYFVLTAPVDVPFDMTTIFLIPATGQRVRLHATGALQVRCADAQLLVAQFVGLPFDDVNGGILRSVSRSVERMLARLLTRRVVLAGAANVVTDPVNQAAIIEELVAYNPAAGAVFGVEMIRMGHLAIAADDGSAPIKPIEQTAAWGTQRPSAERPTVPRRPNDIPLLETVRGRPASMPPILRGEAAPAMATAPPPEPLRRSPSVPPGAVTATPLPAAPTRKKTPLMGVPEMGPAMPVVRATPSSGSPIVSSSMSSSTSGEIALPGVRSTQQSMPAVSLAADDPTPPPAVPPVPIGRQSQPMRTVSPTEPPPMPAVAAALIPAPPPIAKPQPAVQAAVSGEIGARKQTLPPPVAAAAPAPASAPAPAPAPADDETPDDGPSRVVDDPAAELPPPAKTPAGRTKEVTASHGLTGRKANGADAAEPRGSIMGIGMSSIGDVKGGAAVSGEIQKKIAPGARVLVPGPNGLMQSATVRQLLQGYYELEVGSTGQTIWVPMNGVVPE